MNNEIFDNDDEEDSEVVWKDIICNTLMAILVLFIMSLFMINPIIKKTDDSDVTSPGSLMVEIFWDDTQDVDVDLWVKAPNDNPVGFNNKSGRIFNLLRDDMGNFEDGSNRNFETAFARSTPEGEYIVNVHLFQAHKSKPPVNITVIVSLKDNRYPNAPMKQLFTSTVTLTHAGHELTAIRFFIDKQGKPSNTTDSRYYPIVSRN